MRERIYWEMPAMRVGRGRNVQSWITSCQEGVKHAIRGKFILHVEPDGCAYDPKTHIRIY